MGKTIEINEVSISKSEVSKISDYEIVFEVDSMNYLQDFIQVDSLLFLVGYDFRNGYSIFSKIICINLNTEKALWTKKIDNYQRVEYQNISYHNDKLFVSGVVGMKSKEKSNNWLSPSIIVLDLHGQVLKELKLSNKNAGKFTSNLASLNGGYYMTYWNKNGSRTVTNLVKFSNDLKAISTSSIYPNYLYYNKLIVSKNNLYLLASSIHEMFLMEIDTINISAKRKQLIYPVNPFSFEYLLEKNILEIIVVGENEKGQVGKTITQHTLKGAQLRFDPKLN